MTIFTTLLQHDLHILASAIASDQLTAELPLEDGRTLPVTIHAPLEGWDALTTDDAVTIDAAIETVKRHAHHTTHDVVVYLQSRVPADAQPYKHPGWIEHLVRINYGGGGGLTIGVIQRQIGADIERHS